MQEYLIKKEIKSKFNLGRAPWCGGQSERMVGLVKQCLYKTTGKTNLSQNKFEEIVLAIEVTLNKRPLMYVEKAYSKASVDTKYITVWTATVTTKRRSR